MRASDDYNITMYNNVERMRSLRTDDGGFWKPWMIAIVILGGLLCILIAAMVVMLCFCRDKCLGYGKYPKPRIEIADYNR